MLQLTFPRHSRIALACANGIHLRYDVERLGPAQWLLTINADGDVSHSERRYSFTNEDDAKARARFDFRRRQIVKVAA